VSGVLGVFPRALLESYRTPADIVYDYTPNHSRAGPLASLGEFRGYLQADACAGYDALYATGRVSEVDGWAHARRYFWDAKATDAARALPALGLIQPLYRVEADAKGLAAAARRARREERAKPVLERFKPWLDEQADVGLALLRQRRGRHARRDPLQPRGELQRTSDRSVGLPRRRPGAHSDASRSPSRRAAAAELAADGSRRPAVERGSSGRLTPLRRLHPLGLASPIA
jgi:hypothetical protein